MQGERGLTTRMLAKEASFRLIVTGKRREREGPIQKSWKSTKRFWPIRMTQTKRPPNEAA